MIGFEMNLNLWGKTVKAHRSFLLLLGPTTLNLNNKALF